MVKKRSVFRNIWSENMEENINSEKEIDYKELGKEFWKFYSKKGFAIKNKSDADAEIYEILCKLGIIDDTKSALLIGRKLNTTESSIKKIKEDRFFKHKIKDEILKEQVKEIFQSNQIKVSKGSDKITFTIANIAAKLYIEELLHNSKKNYDYTNSPNNISMSIETFVYIAEQIGCDLNAGLKKILNNKIIANTLGNKFKDLKDICSDKTKTIIEKTTEVLKLFAPYANFLTEIIKILSK